MKQLKPNFGNFEPWRVVVFYTAIAVLFTFYIFRLFSLQILRSSDFLGQAVENYTKTQILPAPRGIIYDRNGIILAKNTASYNLVITPAQLPGDAQEPEKSGAIQEIYRQLSKRVGIPVSKGTTDEQTVRAFSPCVSDLGITQIVYIGDTNWPYRPIQIKCNIDQKTAMAIQERASDWPGVGIEVVPIREYPTGGLTSEVIGFLGPLPEGQEDYDCYKKANLDKQKDKVGYGGVEAFLQCDDKDEPLLSGINGKRDVEIDVAGQTLGTIGTPIQPQPGKNLRLTIDTRLQDYAKATVDYYLNLFNTTLPEPLSNNAVVIAINPKTGEILSLVSHPTFENNRMARAIPGDYYNQLVTDPDKPLYNHAISAEHPPGSTFKMAAAIGILNEGVVTPDFEIEDPGKITLENKFYTTDIGIKQDYFCWIYPTTGGGHGLVNFLRGVAESCDVYFYKVGGGYKDEVKNGGLGILRLGEYAKALGYAHPTGIELPGEASGLMPTPDYKRLVQGENWATGDTYIATIGQGLVTSTPIQVLMSIATLANNGIYVKPTLVKEVLDSEGHVVQPFEPKEEWDITRDPMITVFDENDQPVFKRDPNTGNPIPRLDADGKQLIDELTGEKLYEYEKKTVAPWVVKLAQEGMREVVATGTAKDAFEDFAIPSGGKTGTAEYCDDIARVKDICKPGHWPAHAWYVGYAPLDDPEIAVVAFVYHGLEGSKVAAPIVRKVMDAYFSLKQIDKSPASP